MRAVPLCVIALALMCGGPAASATPLAPDELHCYSVAMVGLDSVINARMGVPPERALDLVTTRTDGRQLTSRSTYVLNIILSAYLWNDTPHNYALKVFYRCAQEQARAPGN